MPRVARIVIPGLPHHIAQRGNSRQEVFFGEDNRRVYLGLLAEQVGKCGVGRRRRAESGGGDLGSG